VAIVEGPLTCHITGTLAGAQIEHLLRASKPRNVLGRMLRVTKKENPHSASGGEFGENLVVDDGHGPSWDRCERDTGGDVERRGEG